MELTLTDILRLAGFDVSLNTKIVRHSTKEFPVSLAGRQSGLFELYQAYQRDPVFHRVEQIVSFYGMPGTLACFYGIYRVNGSRAASEGDLPPSGDRSEVTSEEASIYYDLILDERSAFFHDRLIIDWGSSTINWHQRLSEKNNKPVVELLAPGRHLVSFSDFLEFSLCFRELKILFLQHGQAHRDWKTSLSSVAGVYLISDEKTGALYIGSASGAEGIWGRWQNYAKYGHGDNQILMGLVQADSRYAENFRFSILQTLPKSMTVQEVRRREGLYKQKFGKRATALNGN